MRTATFRLPGHPDQACALVAETIVDEYLRRDPTTRIRVAVNGGRGVMFVCGDVLSQADFDVSALVKRTLGQLGITEDIEPFIAIENVPAERVKKFRAFSESVVTVTGYATAETKIGLPKTVEVARHIGKLLLDKRETDPDWFWLGPDAEVTVLAEKKEPTRIILTIEHGSESLDKVRELVLKEVKHSGHELATEVNPLGSYEVRGLARATGSSLAGVSVYGSLIPSLPDFIGRDPSATEKAGAWLARGAALKLLKNDAAAIMVQATYFPGERLPTLATARDEQGRDRSKELTADELALDRVMKEWWRPGLNFEATRSGFAGMAGAPWEES